MFFRLSVDLAVLGSNPAQIISTSTIQNEPPIDHGSDKELKEKKMAMLHRVCVIRDLNKCFKI